MRTQRKALECEKKKCNGKECEERGGNGRELVKAELESCLFFFLVAFLLWQVAVEQPKEFLLQYLQSY